DATACAADHLYWNVYLGSKGGFSTTPIRWHVQTTRLCVIRESLVDDSCGDTSTSVDTLDLNGDGIPDFVDSTTNTATESGRRVYQGQTWVDTNGPGGGFGDAVEWPRPQVAQRTTCPDSPRINIPFYLRHTDSGITFDDPAHHKHWE